MFSPKYEVMKHFASHFTKDLLKYSFYKNNMVKNGSKHRFSNGTAVPTEGVAYNVFYASQFIIWVLLPLLLTRFVKILQEI